jgi:hypothetical protein
VKVAIVGSAPSSQALAPYDDPEWQIWGLNDSHGDLPRWDRWFQIHSRQIIAGLKNAEEHTAWLKAQDKPIYMIDHYPDIPASVKFPKDEIIQRFGRYFNNTVSWLIGKALMEGATSIAVYAVDMAAASEYGTQRPSCEYMIGIARGMGVEVIIPEQSELLKCAWLYGFDDEPEMFTKLRVRRQELKKRADALLAQRGALEREELILRGAVDDLTYIIGNWGQGD